MSKQPGFVITVSCEEFFEDARKSVALFFHQDRIKTVEDLKQRLKNLVRKDFHMLWSSYDDQEENYHYLLEDEDLLFVKPKDKFRICKTKKSSSNLFNNLVEKEITVTEKNTPPSEENGVNEQVDFNHSTNGVNESRKAIPSDDLMEYEDVVDQGTNKNKRKRTRKHKSKKQKIENTTSNVNVVSLTNSFEPTYKPVNTYNSFDLNSRSHIRFQSEVSGNDQIDSKQEIVTENIQFNNVENIEPIKKKKKKSKRKVESPHDTSGQNDEQVNNMDNGRSSVEYSCTPCSVEEPPRITSPNSSSTHMVTSTAVNSPMSAVKKPPRKKYTQSLAGFISKLSESLKNSSKSNGFTDNSDISEINKATSNSSNNLNDNIDDVSTGNNETPCHSNKLPDKIHTDVTKQISSFNGHEVFTQERRSSKTVQSNNVEYSNRKLKKTLNCQSKSPQNKTIEDPHTVLENLKQLKFGNYPNMPLIFERRNSQRREPVSEENRVKETGNESEVGEINETVKQMNGGSPVVTNRIGDIQQVVCWARTMTDQEISTYPVLKDPKENDVIIFKALKMDASYNPSLSDHVCAEVKSICKLSSQLSLHILHGANELKPPVGKFSLEDEENRQPQEEEIFEYSINWNEVYSARLLLRPHNSAEN